jgi:glycosyltransferase involved in cell wall biosynthesis
VIALTVIVPAHDEAAILGANLRRMSDGAHPGIEFIVVANGCSDDTAGVARGVSPGIRVIEIPEPSKIAALNAGDAAATHATRAYVDADVRIDASTLRELAELLAGDGPLVAAPRFEVDTRGSSWAARQYFRVWEHTEYRHRGHVGSGVYALSARGRARFGRFPDVIADDRYVQQLFDADERATLEHRTFTVPAPRTLRAQIGRAARIRRGNVELVARFPQLRSEAGVERHGALLARVARRPSLWPAFPVYVVGTLAPRLRAATSGAELGWSRDETSRVETSRVETRKVETSPVETSPR